MNNLNEDQIYAVENQYWVSMAQALERLSQNPDFKQVILQGYFHDKAVNSVSLLARDSIVSAGHRPAIMEDLIGISSLQDHFITIRNLGEVTPPDENEE